MQTGDNVGIAGIITTGDEPKRVALRGIGPSLRADGAALITSNDNWRESQEDAIADSGFAPDDDRESVILRTLTPGNELHGSPEW